jgi:hypothetical protein
MVRRTKRIERQIVFDISHDQLLMLLLLVETKHDDRADILEIVFVCEANERTDRLVDVRSIGEHFGYSGTRQETAI